jgi:hypothetical protein
MSTALPSFVGATAASAIMVGRGALRRAGFCPDPAKLRPNPRTAEEVIACDRVSARAGAGQARATVSRGEAVGRSNQHARGLRRDRTAPRTRRQCPFPSQASRLGAPLPACLASGGAPGMQGGMGRARPAPRRRAQARHDTEARRAAPTSAAPSPLVSPLSSMQRRDTYVCFF